MKMLLRFCLIYRRPLFGVAAAFAFLAFMLPMMGCAAPTWLTDASQIITLVGASFASIASFVAGLTGNAALAAALAVVSTWITNVQAGLSDIETLVDQYNEAPNPTLLSDIESALADVEQNVQTDFSNLGLPASILSVIAGIAGLALQQLVAWRSLFPSVSISAGSKFTITVPMTKKEFKAAVNKILETPTGDRIVDVALAKAVRL